MKNKFLLLLAVVIVFSGCSYKQFEDYITAKRDGLVTATDSEGNIITDENEDPLYINPNMITPQIKADDIEYVAVGEEYNDWNYITNPNALQYPVHGVEGMRYVVDRVDIYKTFEECGIEKDECYGILDHYLNNDDKDDLNFVIVSLTCSYENPSDDASKNSVYPQFLWRPYYRWESDYEYYEPIPMNSTNPERFYFSEHLVTERIDEIYDEKLTSQNGYFWFEGPINDGESLTIKLGIIVGDWFIEHKNLYLTVHGVSQPDEIGPQIYVDLLGRFDDASE